MAGPRLGLERSGVCDRGPGTTTHREDQFLVADLGGSADVTVVRARTRAAKERRRLPRSRP